MKKPTARASAITTTATSPPAAVAGTTHSNYNFKWMNENQKLYASNTFLMWMFTMKLRVNYWYIHAHNYTQIRCRCRYIWWYMYHSTGDSIPHVYTQHVVVYFMYRVWELRMKNISFTSWTLEVLLSTRILKKVFFCFQFSIQLNGSIVNYYDSK